ncbi:MAG: L,D-transpeptidase family protein [Betaproteobacteria bacterium]|nr:L,D-transpeptidase family protein [Betaproteobacteria bacterium]
MRIPHLALCALLLGPGLSIAAPTPSLTQAQALTPLPDQLLAQALQAVREQRLADAETDINRLLKLQPDFRLAQLIRGDILLARSRPLARLGAVDEKRASKDKLDDLRDEARARLQRHLHHPDPRLLPATILQISPAQPFVLLADAAQSRLYLFENISGEPRLLRDYYLSIGRLGIEKRREGDKKTPLGVYRITAHLPDQRLTDFYGAGAFPLNYPNAWDRIQGRTGHGIWLHGVPSDTYSRAPNSSDGCLVVTNPDLIELRRFVQIGQTPVIIAGEVEWLERSAWATQRKAILAAFQKTARKTNLNHASLFLDPKERLATLDLPARNGPPDTLYLHRQKGRWHLVTPNHGQSHQNLARNDH